MRTDHGTSRESKRRVISQIDIKPREWPANLFLAACFARGDLGTFDPVFGGPTWSNGRSSLFGQLGEAADVIMTSGYGVRTTPHKLAVKRATGSKLVVWHGEQIYGPWAYEIKFPLRRIKEYTRHIDAHLVWGPEMAALLRARYDIPAEQIFIVGSSKFDVLRAPLWRRQAAAEQEILFVSDFALADLTGAAYDRVATKHRWQADMPAKVELYQAARNSFVDCAAAVAQAAPNQRIVVRVHPGESLDAYQRLAPLPNVRFDPAERSFPEALSYARVVLQFTSTSHFETRVAGIPAYRLDLVGWRGHDVHVTYLPWVTPEELQMDLAGILAGTRPMASTRPIEDALARYFSDDHGPSLPRTLAAITEVCDDVAGTEWQMIDRGRVASYLVSHKAKELAARAALLGSRLRLDSRWAAQASVAERRYEDGPNRIVQTETAQEIGQLVEDVPDYLDWAIESSRKRELHVTDVGTFVECPPWE